MNVSGGNDKSTFYMAFGYLDDQGVIEGSGLTRFSGRLKGDYKVTDWLKVGANMNYVNSKSNYPVIRIIRHLLVMLSILPITLLRFIRCMYVELTSRL